MKHLVFSLGIFLTSFSSIAQTVNRCGTMEADSLLRASQSLESLQDFENWLQAKIQQYKQSPEYLSGQRSVRTIPIVFHIIHNGDAVGQNENISQAQVNSQITVLNEDFRKLLNTPGFNTHPAGADSEIEFCAALVDPNGNILTEPGINRVNLGQASWTQSQIDQTVKPQTIWDPERYCNVWVVNFGGSSASLLGYAQFPSSSGLQGINNNAGSANTDGVVVRYTACGRVGTVSAPYNRGRTLTHEIGHWLGLRHIWGDQTCGNDFCNDTPTADGANYGCPNRNSCNDGGTNPPDMVQNYMDYSDDNCMNIFTNDQKTRFNAVLLNSPRRKNLPNSLACTIPVTFSYSGRVIDAQTNQGVEGASVFLDGSADYNVTTDANGDFSLPTMLEGNYTIYAGKWGYVTNLAAQQAYNSSTAPVTIAIQKGYYDDFVFNFGWTESGDAVSGKWARGVPVGTTFTSNGVTFQSNPGADAVGDFLDRCYVTGNGGGQAGTDDVDDGTTILTSPVMDLSTYTEPVMRYQRWFFNAGGSGNPNDSLIISLVNGNQIIDIDRVAAATGTNQWISRSYRVKDFIANPGNNIRLRARTFDLPGTGHLVEAAFDFFRVVDSSASSLQPPVAAFGSAATVVCAGQQVSFTDLSTNNPTNWSWSFPGGSPSTSTNPNPVVTYNTPGTYNVSLTAGNAGGNNSVTLNGYIQVRSVVADFTTDKQAICPGQSVTFTDASLCNPANVQWQFAGGSPATATGNNVEVTYSSPGFYDVVLIATTPQGNDTLQQVMAIQVFSPASLTTSSTPNSGNGNGTATVNVNGGVAPYTYQWSDPQQQTTQTATNLLAGSYSVTVTDFNGCKSITSVTVENQVSVGNIIAAGFIRIYPNPATDVLMLESSINAEVHIVNALGQTILSSSVTGNLPTVLNISQLPVANYVVKVVTEQGIGVYQLSKQ